MEKWIFIILLKGKNFTIGLQMVRITNVIQKLGVKGRSQAVIELIRMEELKL